MEREIRVGKNGFVLAQSLGDGNLTTISLAKRNWSKAYRADVIIE